MDYVLADYTWARAVLLLGPTVATLGMTVQIPLATAADVVLSWAGLGHPHWLDSTQATLLTAAGTVAILAGVFGINCSSGSEGSSSSSGDGQAGQQVEHATAGSLQEPLLQHQDGQEQQVPIASLERSTGAHHAV
jgi:drug/metabolite transporter (DMT)-like permease